MRRALSSALLAVALVATVGDARAERQVLPPESSRSILRALDPHKLDAEVRPGWTLSEVSVKRDFAELILEGAHPAKLVLVAVEASLPNPSLALGETASFRVGLVSAARPSEDLKVAGEALFSALKSADKGTFFRTLDGPSSSPPLGGAPAAEPIEQPTIPVTWTLALGWALALLLMTAGIRSTPAGVRAAHRVDLAAAAGLTVVAGAVRAWMSPMTLLHENTRGPRDLEVIADLSPLLRPMTGTQGAQRLLAELGVEPSISSWAWTNLMWSSLTVGAVYLLLRTLRAERLPSLAGAMTLATLPMAIRISGCEDAFPGSVAHLVAGVLAAALAARSGHAVWLGLSAVLLAMAGVFRPSQYAAGVFLPWALWMAAPDERRRLWGLRPLALVLAAWALIVAPDVGAMLSERSSSSALTIGWWSRPGIHSWPLFDPEVSPVWWMPLGAVGLGLALRARETRIAALGLFAYAFAMSFLLSCDYGWPSSFRRGLSQAWVPAVWIGLACGAVTHVRARTIVAAVIITLSLTTLGTHGDWIGQRYGQQEEIDAQQGQVLPHLLEQPPGIIITPWPTLDELSGTLLTLPLREAGWKIAALEDAERVLESREPGESVYWYRSVACWARKVRGGRTEAGLHPRCAALERSAPWRPKLTFEVSTRSDSDALILGEPGERIELGLFRVEGP